MKLHELLDYFNMRLEQQRHSTNKEIDVDKAKLRDLTIEVEVLLVGRAARFKAEGSTATENSSSE